MEKQNDFTLHFSLRQHTPLIHFQYDQEGATIRATELKPLLDKYLRKNLDAIPDTWLIGAGKPGQPALDYKVKITGGKSSRSLIKKDSDKKYPFFFANMGNEYYKKPVGLVFSSESTHIQLTCLHPPLLEALKKHFPGFIAHTNFAMRDSKGYGCFYLDKDDPAYLPFDQLAPRGAFHFELHLTDLKRAYTRYYRDNRSSMTYDSMPAWQCAMAMTEWFYKALRSGINDGRWDRNQKRFINLFYFKSLAFLYAKNKMKATWDKKAMKTYYMNFNMPDRSKFNSAVQAQVQAHGADIAGVGTNEVLIRDLFGLSTEASWGSYRSTFRTQECKMKNGKPEPIPKSEKPITRFPSPLTFKFLNMGGGIYEVWFWAEEINPDFMGKRFHIQCKRSEHDDYQGDLSLPVPSNFSFDAFFTYLFFEKNSSGQHAVDLKNMVSVPHQNHPHFTVLHHIFQQLQK